MEKRHLNNNRKPSLTLRTETLRRLEDAQLQGAVGGGRLRVPVGVADDTTPIYAETE